MNIFTQLVSWLNVRKGLISPREIDPCMLSRKVTLNNIVFVTFWLNGCSRTKQTDKSSDVIAVLGVLVEFSIKLLSASSFTPGFSA